MNLIALKRMLLDISSYLYKSIFSRVKVPPSLYIPPKLFKEYTMNGRSKIRFWYMDDSQPSNRTIVYKKEQIDLLLEKIKGGKTFYYGQTDYLLYKALEKYSIRNKSVAIMGSVSPVYESICLFLEANQRLSNTTKLSRKTKDW